MVRQFLVIFLALTSVYARTQFVVPYNYVPNSGFEEFTACPDAFSQMERCVAWEQSTAGTADYLNACSSGSGNVSTPSNYMGHQEPHGGVAYAGIICYSTTSVYDYKEYIHVQLKKPLLAGYTYKVSYWISLAEYVSSYAIQNIGAVLSPKKVGFSLWYESITQVSPPLIPDEIVQTTTGWYLVEGTFKLQQEMNFLTIGNFTLSDETEVTLVNPGGDGFAYYYIDDVSVQLVLSEDVFGTNPGNGYDSAFPGDNAYTEDGYTYDVIIPNVFTPNDDGINDSFFIKYFGYIGASITIVNRWGKTVYESSSFFLEEWNGGALNDGVYYYILNMNKIDGEMDTFTGSVQLIR